MKTRFALALLLAGLAWAEPLEMILERMNQNARTARSFAASLQWTEYTDVLGLSEVSTGEIRLMKKGASTIGVVDFKSPNEKKAIFLPGKLQQYLPKANLLQEYDLGKHARLVDRYLILVFGVSGNDLKRDYQVTAGGEETIGGVRTTRLELVPRDKESRDLLSKMELWIPVGQAYAIQQKVTEPNQDYNLWVYTNVQINPNLPESAFTFTPPPGVERKVVK
jgi:hypothetical protein